ncbi:MAG TPA: hypothetical protein VLN91_08620 [Nitrospirota bacterium]|nr:hypothetical protein [Nitrospirota bacterium]
MQRKVCFKASISMGLFMTAALVLAGMGLSEEQQKQDQAPEPELMIVKYGSVEIKSPVPDAKVYVDDIYKGGAGDVVESIVVGEHVISCRTGGRAVSGTFQIKKNETLRLEARFDEGKLVVFKQPPKVEPMKAVVEKKKPEPGKQGKPKQALAEPKKADQINPQEERRRTHLNVMRIEYEVTDAQDIHIDYAAPPVISKYVIKKNKDGKYYRTKHGIVLCDAGPCDLTWSVSFIYTDEAGKTDALLLNWKEIVFNGITPAGTSKRELECCLNGKCWKMQDNSATDTNQEYAIGRYTLSWTKTSVLIRRTDIMEEILAAGRSLSDY